MANRKKGSRKMTNPARPRKMRIHRTMVRGM
jgi:hypothetical protein